MKIDILSMQRIKNYGSVLQAYALKKMIEMQSNTVEFIDIKGLKEIKGSKKIINKLKKIDRYFFKRILFKREIKKFSKNIFLFQKNVLNLNKEKFNSTGDLVVIGSDEIFKADPKSSWGVSSQLFGNIVGAKKVISYAASCGNLKINDIPNDKKNELNKYILKMQEISVRDKNTFNFIKDISNKESIFHLDPVLIYPFYEEINKTEKEFKINSKYMLVYSYSNRIKDKKEIKNIKKFAKKRKLKIISIQGEQYWCDKFIGLSPFEVLIAFKNAEYIFTDTFHGTILSAKFNKNFTVMIRDSNKEKLSDLIERLDLKNHVLTDVSQLEKTITQNFNYTKFNEIIENERKRTFDYLDKYVGNKVK